MKAPGSISLASAGIGLRREHLEELKQCLPQTIDFLELAPENWIGIGGRRAKALAFFREHYPIICHGLSLSIGSPAPLDETFILRIKDFLEQYDIPIYSEHLSYCSDEGHLYDLMPIPFTQEAVDYVANRVKRVQEILERRIALENVSYYGAPGKEMEEIDFINAVLEQADCDLLLDVNNIYVNSFNHGYDAKKFLTGLTPNHIAYIHIAGHYREGDECIIDTHGADVIDPVWELLDLAYQHFGVLPTLLERDNDVPPLSLSLQEIERIKHYQRTQDIQHEPQRQNA